MEPATNIQVLAGAIADIQNKSATIAIRGHLAFKRITDLLPSGSGLDSGSTVDLEKSSPSRIVFKTAFHHMDGNGYYAGWTEHTVVVVPDFIINFNLTVTGRNRNDIKEYIADIFREVLAEEAEADGE